MRKNNVWFLPSLSLSDVCGCCISVICMCYRFDLLSLGFVFIFLFGSQCGQQGVKN